MRRFVLALPLLLAAPVLAADFDSGAQAFRRGDDRAALEIWRPLAEAGDPKAQYALGYMLHHGRGTPKHLGEAIAWYRKAAEGDDPDAIYTLGMLAENGWGMAKDPAAAADRYREALRWGPHPEAAFALGRLYLRGIGVASDPLRALEWVAKAAEHGHAGACYLMGSILEAGWGVPPDLVRAYYWYARAAAAPPARLTAIDPAWNARKAVAALKDRLGAAEIRQAEAMLARATE